MGGRAHAVAGTIDASWTSPPSLSLLCKILLIGGMRSQVVKLRLILTRKQNEMSAVVMPITTTGGYVSGASKVAGLTGKTNYSEGAVNFGLDALISGILFDEAGNLGSLLESSTIWYEDPVGIT